MIFMRNFLFSYVPWMWKFILQILNLPRNSRSVARISNTGAVPNSSFPKTSSPIETTAPTVTVLDSGGPKQREAEATIIGQVVQHF